MYILQNFGTLCITLSVSLLSQLISPLVKKFLNGKLAYLSNKIKDFTFKNYWLGFFNETFLFLAICTALNFDFYKWNSYGNAVNSLLTSIFAALLLVFIFFIGFFYNRSENYALITKRDKTFFNSYGSVIKGLNFKRKGKSVLVFVFVGFMRKLLLAYLLVF